MKDIEFLPEHHIRARRNYRLRFIRLWLLIVTALVMVCWTFFSHNRLAAVERELDETRKSVSMIDTARQHQLWSELLGDIRKYNRRKELVRDLVSGRSRMILLGELAERTPNELVLTHVDVRRVQREVLTAATAATRRRGRQQGEKRTETLDRVRVEGYAATDLALARFLQNLADSSIFQGGELVFSKDATFKGREVRVFAATFTVTPSGGRQQATLPAEEL